MQSISADSSIKKSLVSFLMASTCIIGASQHNLMADSYEVSSNASSPAKWSEPSTWNYNAVPTPQQEVVVATNTGMEVIVDTVVQIEYIDIGSSVNKMNGTLIIQSGGQLTASVLEISTTAGNNLNPPYSRLTIQKDGTAHIGIGAIGSENPYGESFLEIFGVLGNNTSSPETVSHALFASSPDKDGKGNIQISGGWLAFPTTVLGGALWQLST